MKLPSLELLSSIFNMEVFTSKFDKEKKTISINTSLEISIYELAHKCKEWAFKIAKFPIKLETSPTDEYGEEYSIGSWFLCRIEGNHPKTNNNIARYTLVYYGQTEPEAIFSACEWILKQLK